MRKICVSIAIVAVLLFSFSELKAQEANSIKSLKDVRKIYFDKWKISFEEPSNYKTVCRKHKDCSKDCRLSAGDLEKKGKYFLSNLQNEFADRRFEVVSNFEEADAILTMKVILKKDCRISLCQVVGGVYVDDIDAKLQTADGRKLWSVSFFYSNNINTDIDNFRQQAGWLAEKISKSRDKLQNGKEERTFVPKEIKRISF